MSRVCSASNTSRTGADSAAKAVCGARAARKFATCAGFATMPISTTGMLVRTDMRPDAIVDWIANALISGWSSPSGSAWTRGQRRKTASATVPMVSVEITCATTTATNSQSRPCCAPSDDRRQPQQHRPQQQHAAQVIAVADEQHGATHSFGLLDERDQ